MSIHTDIVNLESILTNSRASEYSPDELASMEEKLLKLKHIENLWSEFGNVPMDPKLEIIEQNWHGFPAGTWRETIWHWFEKEFNISIAEDLMYEDDAADDIDTDNLVNYIKDYIRSELRKHNLDGTDDEMAEIMMELIRSNSAAPNLLAEIAKIINIAIKHYKNSRPDYIVEIFNPDTNESCFRVETYTNPNDAEKLMDNIIRLSSAAKSDGEIGARIKRIRYDVDGNEIDTEVLSEKR